MYLVIGYYRLKFGSIVAIKVHRKDFFALPIADKCSCRFCNHCPCCYVPQFGGVNNRSYKTAFCDVRYLKGGRTQIAKPCAMNNLIDPCRQTSEAFEMTVQTNA